MNTISPRITDYFLQAYRRGGAWFSVSCRGSIVKYPTGLVGECSSNRLLAVIKIPSELRINNNLMYHVNTCI
jgi:hypothetical protein